eukprot:TRINITY_DN8120_c0_g2_i2.p1 TRINITY_DN8120_c0_g2~~TRINITY_DN8120_c0_g2_i2.p1  ORF type:complete len:116 (+),score=9.93 TRINITY_DN8120_c0_g2_i2:83-430(+)
MEPWQTLYHPVWRDWWMANFQRQKPYGCTDRCTLGEFAAKIEKTMTKEGLSEVQFEQDIAPFISRTFDPEDSGLVTIQQINNTEQIGIDAAESSSFSHLVKELVKGTMCRIKMLA